MAEIADVRARLKLSKLSDEEILPHLRRAIIDFKKWVFESEEEKIEAISCLTIAYLTPQLWIRIANRANEYEENLNTFKDMEEFIKYWRDRANGVSKKKEESETTTGSDRRISWGVV